MDFSRGENEQIAEPVKLDFNSKDKKNKVNRSNEEVSIDILEKIEKGIDIEFLETTSLPVFCYQTQITIHGKFPANLSTNRVGGYKNLFQNQNGSIGIKYNAIDFSKKNDLIKVCENLDYNENQWRANLNSSSFSLSQVFKFPTKEEALTKFNEVKLENSKFPKDSIIGVINANCFYNSWFGVYVLVNDLVISAIYEEKENDLYKFLFKEDKATTFIKVNANIEKENLVYKKREEENKRNREIAKKKEIEENKKIYDKTIKEYKKVNKLTYGLYYYFTTNEYQKIIFFVGKENIYSIEEINSWNDSKHLRKDFNLHLNNDIETTYVNFIKEYEELGAKKLGEKYPKYNKPIHTTSIKNFIKNNFSKYNIEKLKGLVEKNGAYLIKQ